MNVRILAPTLLAGALAVTGCGPQESASSESQKTAITQEATQGVKALFAAVERLDPDYPAKFCTDGINPFYVDTDGKAYTFDETCKLFKDWGSQFQGQKFDLKQEKTTFLAPDLVLYACQGKCDVTQKDGGHMKFESYGASFLLRKVGGTWRMAYCQESGTPPVMVKAEAGAAKK